MSKRVPSRPPISPDQQLRERARELRLHGLLAHWSDYAREPWLPLFLEREESERRSRSLERRVRAAQLGRFKPLADFDWSWPQTLDRARVEELLTLAFLEEAANVVFVGPNGVGKTTLAQVLVHTAVLAGHTARFVTASQLLNDLAGQDGTAALARRFAVYARPTLLAIDEVGYLSYDSRHADLLFEVVSRRNQSKATVITTNRPFAEWGEVFPNASCVVALVDRLVHRAEIVPIEGESYRLKEAKEREQRRAKSSKKPSKRKPPARSRRK